MDTPVGKVQTVLGVVDPSALGYTQTHEHLLCDVGRKPPHELAAGERRAYYEPIRLDNYHRIRRSNTNLYDRRLLNEADAIEEVERYKALGGGTIVDATSIGIGRDPGGLARISRATDVHVIMGSGYYVGELHPPEVEQLSEEQLAENIVGDIVDGVDGTGIKAGLIGEIGMTWPVQENEPMVLRAAARAQSMTGAPLMIHPGRVESAPLEHVRVVEEAGGNSERTIICHVERTLFDLRSMIELARTGCYVEFDLFGQEFGYYAFAAIDMPNDATRVDYLIGLIEAGYRDRLLVSQDIYRKTALTKYGGEGYGHILENVVPLMQRKGMTQDDIDVIMLHNPARILAFV